MVFYLTQAISLGVIKRLCYENYITVESLASLTKLLSHLHKFSISESLINFYGRKHRNLTTRNLIDINLNVYGYNSL